MVDTIDNGGSRDNENSRGDQAQGSGPRGYGEGGFNPYGSLTDSPSAQTSGAGDIGGFGQQTQSQAGQGGAGSISRSANYDKAGSQLGETSAAGLPFNDVGARNSGADAGLLDQQRADRGGQGQGQNQGGYDQSRSQAASDRREYGGSAYRQGASAASQYGQGDPGRSPSQGSPPYYGEARSGSDQQDPSSAPRHPGAQVDQRYGDHHDHHEPHYRQWRDTQIAGHDRDYARWRDEQIRKYDEDYKGWRNERHSAFSRDFEGWRTGRSSDASSDAASNPSVGVAREAVVNPNAVHGANPTLANIADGHAGEQHHHRRPEDDNSVDSQG